MKVIPRLFFVAISLFGLAMYAYTGITAPDKLSDDMIFGHWAAVFALLMLLTAALQTKGDVAMPVMFAGVFFAILSFGMYKQSGGAAYGAFAWLGIMLSGTAIASKAMDHIPSRASFSQS